TVPREASAVADTSVADEASLQAEHELALTKAKRRGIQRKLVKLGYEARVSGKFDDATRNAIARWQEDRGFAKTGYLDATQHKELLSEAATSSTADSDRHSRRRARHARGGGGPIGFIGNAVSGIFRR